MSAESTANRLIRAAAAAQFHKNGSKEPLLWNLVIATILPAEQKQTRFATGAAHFGGAGSPVKLRRSLTSTVNGDEDAIPIGFG